MAKSDTVTRLDAGVARALWRGVRAWLEERNVEQHYSAETLAALLGVTTRTIWNYVNAWERSGGVEGIGPVVKISHKVVRIPASSARRFLAARTIGVPAAGARSGGVGEAGRASAAVGVEGADASGRAAA